MRWILYTLECIAIAVVQLLLVEGGWRPVLGCQNHGVAAETPGLKIFLGEKIGNNRQGEQQYRDDQVLAHGWSSG